MPHYDLKEEVLLAHSAQYPDVKQTTFRDDWNIDDEAIGQQIEQYYCNVHRYVSVHEPVVSEYRGNSFLFYFTDRRFAGLRYSMATNWRLTKSFWSISVRPFTAILLVLGCVSVFLCTYFNWTVKMDKWPLGFLTAAVIFPLSFGVSYSHNRRENLLLDIASFKTDLIVIFQLFREWTNTLAARPQGTKISYEKEYRRMVTELLFHVVVWLNHQKDKRQLFRIYKQFDRISQLCELLRTEDDWVRSLLSRIYQYQRYALIDLEKIRVVHDFRTVSTLRGFLQAIIPLFCILIAPSLAHLNLDENFAATSRGGTVEQTTHPHFLGYITAGVLAIMLSSLYHVMTDLEDPFDFPTSPDDINLVLLKEVQLHFFKPDLTTAPKSRNTFAPEETIEELFVSHSASKVSKRSRLLKRDGTSPADLSS